MFGSTQTGANTRVNRKWTANRRGALNPIIIVNPIKRMAVLLHSLTLAIQKCLNLSVLASLRTRSARNAIWGVEGHHTTVSLFIILFFELSRTRSLACKPHAKVHIPVHRVTKN